MKSISFLESKGIDIPKSLELFGDMDTYNDTLNDFLSEVLMSSIKTCPLLGFSKPEISLAIVDLPRTIFANNANKFPFFYF